MTTPSDRSGGTVAPSGRADEVETAWQHALASEHQAVFGYGLIGPRLAGNDRQLAVTCSADHETSRNAIAAEMAAAGMLPVSADADYPALYPVPDAASARRVAVGLEDACATAWRYLYAQCVASSASHAATLRAQAQQQLIAAAVRGSRWRLTVDPAKATTAFPGIS